MSTETTLSKKEKTELILRNVYNLPPIPKVIDEALKLLDNEKTSGVQLSLLISKDQSLVTKILSIANSPLYGLQRRVSTIDFAITVLGFSELRNIVMILSMIESFKNKSDKYLNQKEFWVHSFLVGSGAKKITEDLKLKNSSEAFIAGFLHDLGVSVIHRYFHSNFVNIFEKIYNDGTHPLEAERDVLGIDHAEIGYVLLEKWNFPKSLCKPVQFHHNPAETETNIELASVVHLVDFMTQEFQTGNFRWDEGLELDGKAMEVLNFSSDQQLRDFMESYREVFSDQIENIRLFQ